MCGKGIAGVQDRCVNGFVQSSGLELAVDGKPKRLGIKIERLETSGRGRKSGGAM